MQGTASIATGHVSGEYNPFSRGSYEVKLATAFEEVGIVREEHETPEEYVRRAAGEPRVARLGEIASTPASVTPLVEEFLRSGAVRSKTSRKTSRSRG